MELLWRPLRHQLGAEELLELGRPVPMYRYAHTPFLSGRREAGRAEGQAQGNLFQPARNLLGQGAPAQSSTLTKVLIIGIPVLFVFGLYALNRKK